MSYIKFFDTTLRDGEQTPGVRISFAHKLEVARSLERMGVDIIEAGFPASSNGDFDCVKAISEEIKDSTVCALCRATEGDINRANEALQSAKRKRLHIFIATSDLHIQYKLKMTRDEVLDAIENSVSYAATLCDDIEFSAEDASRSDYDFLIKAIGLACCSGATTINIPDTVGFAEVEEYGTLIKNVRAFLDKNEKEYGKHIALSCHCHNDLGTAVACSMAAIKNGAEQVECTVNGIGERAGNASLEEIAIGLYVKKSVYNAEFGIKCEEIARTSKLVSALFDFPVSKNKAIVGENVFTHSSGIHQHGVIQNAMTYQIFTPDVIGLSQTNLVLGKLSGKHAFSKRIEEFGYRLTEAEMKSCFEKFKSFADKKEVSDEDIKAIVNDCLESRNPIYELETFQIQSGNKMSAMAMVTLKYNGGFITDSAVGNGPIDAAFNALNRLCGIKFIQLEEYNIDALTEGHNALGEARVKVKIEDGFFHGKGVSSDIIKASIRAYISAINKWAKETITSDNK